MQENAAAGTNGVSPQEQLIQMAWAHQASSMVYVTAKLKLADLLADGPRSSEDLAQATGTHAPSLYRYLRTAAGMGLFREDDAHHFSLTEMAQPLRSGVPGSVRTSVLTVAGEIMTRPLHNLQYSLQTGRPAFDQAFGMPVFDWLGQNPEQAAMFSDLMIGFHGPETGAVAAAYDFSGLATIADAGGATGNMLTTILARNPEARGILFDLPHNAGAAAELIAARGMSERVRFEAGSFFEKIPSGADVYLMSHIIHDWNEEQCLTILRNCRAAMGPKSRLLIIEMVIPSGNEFHPGKMTDMIMLAVPGGQERTEAEYGALLAKGGFRLERVVPTQSAASVVEAFPV